MARFEVVVCGASIAGSLAGYVSARLGRATAIIDFPAAHLPGDVLAAEAKATLDQLGLGYKLDGPHHIRCLGTSRITAAGTATDYLWRGFVLDRARFASDLFDAAIAAGCHCIQGRLVALSGDVVGNGLRMSIATSAGMRQIQAAFAIDASGRKTVIARRFGARRRILTNLVAAWAELPVADIGADPGTLAVEAAGAHWWYVAVGRRSAAAAVLGRRPPKDPDTWLTAACSTKILRQLPPSCEPRPAVWPANFSVLEPTVSAGWVACGDAAATFDPLTGYGLAFAVGSGYAAARAADTFLRGDRLAPVLYSELVADRVQRAWNGLPDAYQGIATALPQYVRSKSSSANTSS